jgi:hypothetical protein
MILTFCSPDQLFSRLFLNLGLSNDFSLMMRFSWNF